MFNRDHSFVPPVDYRNGTRPRIGIRGNIYRLWNWRVRLSSAPLKRKAEPDHWP